MKNAWQADVLRLWLAFFACSLIGQCLFLKVKNEKILCHPVDLHLRSCIDSSLSVSIPSTKCGSVSGGGEDREVGDLARGATPVVKNDPEASWAPFFGF